MPGGGAGMRDGFLFDDAHGTGADISGDDALLVIGHIDHVGAILAGAEDPIHFVGGRVVASDGFGGLGGEPRLPTDERPLSST
jgi:hypothetical protein